MKHTYTDEQYQKAIDKACKIVAEGPHRPGYPAVELDAKSKFWVEEKEARLDLIKEAVRLLPEPEPPVVDGKTPGQVMHEVMNGCGKWKESSYRDEYEAAASVVLAAFGGKVNEKPVADYVDIAEKLCALGWTASNDAQWEGLRDALPELRNMLGGQSEMIDRQPAEIPWIEWGGGECPLKDEEVEKWQYRFRDGFTKNEPVQPRCYVWTHTNTQDDIIAYRVLKWRDGCGPVDWKAKYEDAEKNLRAKFEPEVKEANARADKAEAELARITAAAHEAGWNGVDNPKDLAQFIKRQAEELTQSHSVNAELIKEKLTQSQFSQLRPISEAGLQGCNGMSLRDWFAWQALAIYRASTPLHSTPSQEILAGWAYQQADAMLAAREVKP